MTSGRACVFSALLVASAAAAPRRPRHAPRPLHEAAKAPDRPALLFDIASSYDKGGDRQRAIGWYKKYLATAHGDKDTAVARARVDVLERQLAGDEKVDALPFVEPTTKHTFRTRLTL